MLPRISYPAALPEQPSLDHVIIIRTLGRHPTHIKLVLSEIKNNVSAKKFKTTEMYCCSIRTDGAQWLRHCTRHSRPLHSISLDKGEKAPITQDLADYLHPLQRNGMQCEVYHIDVVISSTGHQEPVKLRLVSLSEAYSVSIYTLFL
jgi:hypothetical protein